MTSEKVLVDDYLNGHVGSVMVGFGKFHGDFGIGQINDGEIKLLRVNSVVIQSQTQAF